MGIKFIIVLKEALYSLLVSGKKSQWKITWTLLQSLGPIYVSLKLWLLLLFSLLASKECCASHSIVSNSL